MSLLSVAGLCNSWHWNLAASVEGHLRFAGAHLQCAECHDPADRRWHSGAHRRLLRLLWRDHGEQMHAGHGMMVHCTVTLSKQATSKTATSSHVSHTLA